MPGPPPKHPSVRARRNNPKKDFVTLPAAGRKGPIPVWLLEVDLRLQATLDLASDRQTALLMEIEQAEDGRERGRLKRELARVEMVAATTRLQIEQGRDAEVALWATLWATPQAVLWEQTHAHREVAQYVRWKIRAEQGDVKAASEARLLSDRLGLNPLALLRLRAEVERVDEVEDRGARRRSLPKQPKKPGDDPRAGLYAVS